ncbi:hypothetical protein Q1M63_24475 [Sinorhizobium meliloti]|nr:hypothetical protein Q1M63_24475 [Sinorhizobium meliloti]
MKTISGQIIRPMTNGATDAPKLPSKSGRKRGAARPEIWQISAAMKAGDKRLKAWDNANPNPLTWEDSKRLEAEFDRIYIPKDFS